MRYDIIGSSSKGNAIVVEDILLLDCGVSFSKLKPYLKKIKLIFIFINNNIKLNQNVSSFPLFNLYSNFKYLVRCK